MILKMYIKTVKNHIQTNQKDIEMNTGGGWSPNTLK